MRDPLQLLSYFVLMFLITGIISCGPPAEIPLPAQTLPIPQPTVFPISYSTPTPITWPEPRHINPPRKKLSLTSLPTDTFNRSGFISFSTDPEELPFNMVTLPSTPLIYDSLPSVPLKYQNIILPPPTITNNISIREKQTSEGMVYEMTGFFNTNDSIHCIYKDGHGFIWIASRKTLSFYDGVNIFTYSMPSTTKYIYNILEDKNGFIWVATSQAGLLRIDRKKGLLKQLFPGEAAIIVRLIQDTKGRIWASTNTGVFVIDESADLYKNIGKNEGLTGVLAGGMVEDRDGNIWIGTYTTGVSIVNLEKQKISFLNVSAGLSTDSSTVLLQDKKNRMWIASVSGKVDLVDVKQKKIIHYDHRQGLKSVRIFNICLDQKGFIWLGTFGVGVPGNGVEIIDVENKKIQVINDHSGLNSWSVVSFAEDDVGQMWVGTASGLNMIRKKGIDASHVGSESITTIYEDPRGWMWIGKQLTGVEIFDPSSGLVRRFTRTNGLSTDTITNIFGQNGEIWIASVRGLDIVDSAATSFEHLGQREGLPSDTLTNVAADYKNRLWLGGGQQLGIGLNVYDPANKLLWYLGEKEGIVDTCIIEIKKDHQRRLWFTSLSGRIGIINSESNTLRYVNNMPLLKLPEVYTVFLQDSKNNMWIGSSKGLHRINAEGDSAVFFDAQQILHSNTVNSLNEFDGKVYVGTNAGITIISPPLFTEKQQWKYQYIGKGDGIHKVAPTYYSDLITKNGEFWWGDRGITIVNHFRPDSVSSQIVIAGLKVVDQQRFYSNSPWNEIGNTDTLWSSKKDTFYVKGKLPPLQRGFIGQVFLSGDIQLPYQLPGKLDLTYNQNDVQFQFAQKHLGSQDAVVYRYILEGLDKKWSDPTTNSFSENYRNLSAGSYVFKVTALFNNQWLPPAKFAFTIAPPWWRTVWAYLTYLLLFVFAVWRIVVWRSSQLKKENLALEQKVKRRTEQLNHSLEELKATQSQLIQREKMASLGELTAGIAHEIQNPLNFVNNFSEINTELLYELNNAIDNGNVAEVKDIAANLVINEQKITEHGKRADSIVKSMLQHSRTSSGKKEPLNINSLADEYLRLSYHGMRAKDKGHSPGQPVFNAAMETAFDPDLPEVNVVAQDIGRVLLNLFNNAFQAVAEKQSLNENSLYQPKVFVQTQRSNKHVVLTVKDNGNGIPDEIRDKIFQPFFTTKRTGEGTGLGLSLSYDIITKGHGGELKVESVPGEGSEFTMSLPI